MTVLLAGGRGREGSLTVIGLALVAWGGAAGAATVVSVDSGDTLRVREAGAVRTIRLACLEAPALTQAPHGEQAKATLRRLLPEGSAVVLTPIGRRAGAPPGDLLAEVASRSGLVNVELVRAGQAFTTLEAQPQCDSLRYGEAENSARFQRLGVWRVEGGIQRPREWRIAEAEGKTRRLREQALQEQLRRERDARRTVALQPRQGSLATGRATPPPGIYQQCVATAREKFREGSGGMTPPAGVMERFCSCLLKPKANESYNSLGERCTQQLLETITRSMQAG
jgi:endonuclease YncB( thermonuclease family)